ncbi:MAG: exo-alpha-sialidase [Ignavibacteria bacterium]|nr:exo-alpha-sialidase [Ignavibacteria bacterium]
MTLLRTIRVTLLLRILPLLWCSVAMYGQLAHQPWLYKIGAWGYVALPDGSLLSSKIMCIDSVLKYNVPFPCDSLILTRSMDGGRTWKPEAVSARNTNTAEGMVILKNGRLLTGGQSNDFWTSYDGGRTWVVSSQGPSNEYISGGFVRDERGVLYWRTQFGGLYMSFDEGVNATDLNPLERALERFFIDSGGTIMQFDVRSDMITMVMDHGRRWRNVARMNKEPEGFTGVNGVSLMRDTLFLSYVWKPGDGRLDYVTAYWNSQTESWSPYPRYLDVFLGSIMDSTGAIFVRSATGVQRQRATETHGLYVLSPPPPKNAQPTDSARAPEFRNITNDYVEGIFMDLDGRIHVYNDSATIPPSMPRPISIIDKLYTCNGVQYVISGKALLWASPDPSRSENAYLHATISPNRRVSYVNIEVVDSTKPMRVTFSVGDAVFPTMWITDSIIPRHLLPVISPTVNFQNRPILKCTWPYGPFLWYFNDQPYIRPQAYEGPYCDSVVPIAGPGSYKTRGRNKYGCDVWSEEYIIPATSITAITSSNMPVHAWFDSDWLLHVQWDSYNTEQPYIRVFDALGRDIAHQVSSNENEKVYSMQTAMQLVFVTANFGSFQHVMIVPRY